MRLFVPKAVLFDLDGVLINSLANHYHAWRTILSEYQIEVTKREIALGEGERAEDSLRRFFREKANRELTPAEVERLLHKKRSLFRDSNPPRLIPEAKNVLEYFRSEKILLGLVSGSAITNIRNSLTEADLSLFDVMVTGEADLPGKPDPAPYLEAMRQLDVKPDECWVVENAPFGILAAKAAGAFTIALTTTLTEADLAGADVYESKIEEVVKLYHNLISKSEKKRQNS